MVGSRQHLALPDSHLQQVGSLLLALVHLDSPVLGSQPDLMEDRHHLGLELADNPGLEQVDSLQELVDSLQELVDSLQGQVDSLQDLEPVDSLQELGDTLQVG